MALLSTILNRASILLQDIGNVRWSSDELVLWANDGVREISIVDPISVQKQVTLSLVAGALQTLPTEAILLIDVVGNTQPSGAAGGQIRMCERPDLDARFPKWQMESPKGTIANVMYDPKYRKAFWTYPPAIAGTRIDVVYSYEPVDMAATDTVPLDSQYLNALLDYIMFRAYSKETEQQASQQKAVAHYGAFTNALTTIISNRTGGSPKDAES